MISVSMEAAEKFKEVTLKSNVSENAMLRVAFGGFGWGGPSLHLVLDELKTDEDVVVESQGINVVYEAELEDYVKNSVIDYSNKWFEKGFVLRGARASSC